MLLQKEKYYWKEKEQEPIAGRRSTQLTVGFLPMISKPEIIKTLLMMIFSFRLLRPTALLYILRGREHFTSPKILSTKVSNADGLP